MSGKYDWNSGNSPAVITRIVPARTKGRSIVTPYPLCGNIKGEGWGGMNDTTCTGKHRLITPLLVLPCRCADKCKEGTIRM